MLEKLGLPENCIKNLNIPLNKLFTEKEINDFQIIECKLYASINYDLLNIPKKQKSDSRFDEIHFVYLRISNLYVHSDLHRIVRKIYRTIKYQVIVIIQLNNMMKLAAGFITPGKVECDKNIIQHFLFTKWFYDDYETKEINDYFSDISKAIVNEKDIHTLYKSLYKTISRFIEESNYSENELIDLIEYIQELINANENFPTEIKSVLLKTYKYKHSDGRKYQVEKDDIKEIYPSECVWYAINTNEQVKNYCNKKNKKSLSDITFCDYRTAQIENAENYNSDNIFLQKITPPKIWDSIPDEDMDYVYNEDNLYEEDLLNTDDDSDNIEKWYSIIDDDYEDESRDYDFEDDDDLEDDDFFDYDDDEDEL